MILRDYRPADFRRLCEIDRRCFDPGKAYQVADMAVFLRRRGSLAIVAEDARGEIAAFVLAQKHGQDRGRIVTLDVLPGHRGKGTGRRLMLSCEERLRKAGVRVVRLETAVSNEAAQGLYRSLGYTFVKVATRYYADGEDAWVMEKTLEQPDVCA